MKLWSISQTKQAFVVLFWLCKVTVNVNKQMLQIRWYNFIHGND
jgi:hypothetical protein